MLDQITRQRLTHYIRHCFRVRSYDIHWQIRFIVLRLVDGIIKLTGFRQGLTFCNRIFKTIAVIVFGYLVGLTKYLRGTAYVGGSLHPVYEATTYGLTHLFSALGLYVVSGTTLRDQFYIINASSTLSTCRHLPSSFLSIWHHIHNVKMF